MLCFYYYQNVYINTDTLKLHVRFFAFSVHAELLMAVHK